VANGADERVSEDTSTVVLGKRTASERQGMHLDESMATSETNSSSQKGLLQRQEDLSCNICTESLTEGKAVLDCDHFFCLECIKKWAEIENTCPLCKKRFSCIKERRMKRRNADETSNNAGEVFRWKDTELSKHDNS
jgi:hypothetical protein